MIDRETLEELSKRMGELAVENTILATRIKQEMRNKEEVEKKYIEAIQDLTYYRDLNVKNVEESDKNE